MTEPLKPAPAKPHTSTLEADAVALVEEYRAAAEKRAQLRRAERDTFNAR